MASVNARDVWHIACLTNKRWDAFLAGNGVIRISLRRDDSRTIVSIAGKLEEKYLAELREQCSATTTKLVFDLSDLTSADKPAICWLSERLARGDEILGASPYIKLLLEREQPSSDSPAAIGSRSINEGND